MITAEDAEVRKEKDNHFATVETLSHLHVFYLLHGSIFPFY